ncbi:tRNA N(3)-methylcytidine methyltransferase METTL6 isoform X4 [Scyliorhinus torazame]|uniref:tRNA N(3)-methylcytidine methyltransferase METTL6 isoform X4 n=1 Tax=Scyliorhinus torazame TaxID=75743 RepID=UPI003B5A4F3C
MFFFPQLDRPSARRRRRPLNSNSKHADVAREPRPRAPIGSAGARPGRSGARARARRPVLVKARGPGRQWRTRGLGREARLGPIIPLFGRWGYVGSNIWNIETIMEDDIETNEFFATQTYQREGLNNCSLSSKVATVTPSKSDVPFQVRGDRGRILTPEEAEKLINDQSLVSDFKQQKLEIDAQKNWDLFYKRNSTNFFKDRHWTTREFEELKACREFENQKLILLEAGCGVGNCLFPLLEDDLNVFIYACDFSPRAIEFVKVSDDLFDMVE